MSTKVNVVIPARTAMPRGATWVGQAFDALRALGIALGATRRANRRVRDAAWLRDYAARLQGSDPRMASELQAAADRHAG